jgi:hypothetical protein
MEPRSNANHAFRNSLSLNQCAHNVCVWGGGGGVCVCVCVCVYIYLFIYLFIHSRTHKDLQLSFEIYLTWQFNDIHGNLSCGMLRNVVW